MSNQISPQLSHNINGTRSLSLMTIVLIVVIIGIILFLIGMFGYRILFKMDWTDSFYTTALTMAGLGLEVKPCRKDQKIFVGIFTLLSVGFYLIVIAAIIACMIQPFVLTAINSGRQYTLLP